MGRELNIVKSGTCAVLRKTGAWVGGWWVPGGGEAVKGVVGLGPLGFGVVMLGI